jgi:hypothetical protein
MANLGFQPFTGLFRQPSRLARHPGWALATVKQAGRQVAKTSAVYHALDMTVKGNLLSVPLVAFAAASAPRGERASRVAAETAGILAYPVMAAAIAALLPEGVLLTASVRATIAMLAAAMPNMAFVESANRVFSHVSRAEQRTLRIETGGNYQDSETAQAFRFNSVNEMSSAFQASRTWLGREAVFLK